jgi:polyhydroxyalkanoate synthesis repressor PhaR
VPEGPIRIKRYPNRRFYASHTSSYLALADIEKLVREGADVEIVDSQTGEDLTRPILVQIIAERHPDKMAMFPAAMLHAMLRANDVVSGFLQDYFRNSLAYLDYLQRHGSSGPLAQPVHWMKAWLERWSKPAGHESAAEATAAATAELGPRHEQSMDMPPMEGLGERDAMAARMHQLEERIAMLERERAGN